MSDIDITCPDCGGRRLDRDVKACMGRESCEPFPIVPHTVEATALLASWMLYCTDCAKQHFAYSRDEAETWATGHPCETLVRS